MRPFLLLALILALANCEQRPLVFTNWPPKSRASAGAGVGAGPPGKPRTLVVQIRSDQPVPLVLKGRPGHGPAHAHSHAAHSHAAHLAHPHSVHPHVLSHAHSHAHLHSHPLIHVPQHQLQYQHQHLRGPPRHTPIKLNGPSPVYLKPAVASLRKPLKIKLNNVKPKAKPTFGYDKPFKYEKPAVSYSELQNLPLDTHNNFNTEHFAPIYTVPAPNLADNHLDVEEGHLQDASSYLYTPPSQIPPSASAPIRPQTYLPPKYSVHEDETNDQTIRDPISGSQKLFAPDPDPSLPTTKIRPATESFNTPSNNKPLPADVQSNHLPAQPLVQIVGAQAAAQTAPEIYPIQYAQPAAAAVQSQSFLAAIPAAHIPIYNPTYLVTQSNQLYSAHQQQLFKPSSEPVVESGYVNADLTQEVASNGQILQAAKDPHHNIHPVLDAAPQYAALIAAPALGSHGESGYETASFHLPNVASAVTASIPEGGFVVSNFYGHTHDSSQLLQAYAEEESRRQQLETEHAATELQRQQQLHLDELKAQAQEQQQQHQLHLEELRAQAQYQQQQQQFEELQAQAQEQHLQQQHQQQQLQLLQLQQQHQQLQQPVQHHPQQQLQPVQHQQQQQLQQQQQVAQDPAASAFEEHQRLVQQQLGPNTPLRIFVPDEEASESRLQKRSDDVKKGTVEDVPSKDLIESDSEESAKDLFEVSTSVEVAGQHLTASSN
ncbi:mediator of RNA polymerase II transcription subunit 12 isoform X1 [Drosophila gunungcola]|uniref:mediator of RNA polymerase II transcription subunit 12 isoform X1 n=1 Tax=Drosophila gunungcola TaxID=103775 RepID=UPI0022E05171|nr:mediator of RNA polymerase II transcription subunit 12 isoform X1 [Drosophila gunungcola]